MADDLKILFQMMKIFVFIIQILSLNDCQP